MRERTQTIAAGFQVYFFFLDSNEKFTKVNLHGSAVNKVTKESEATILAARLSCYDSPQ
jgi:hypothetical protein